MEPLLIIASLQTKLNQLAHGALQRPVDKSLFEYGQAVGAYQGVLQAIQEVQRLMQGVDEET